MGIDRNYNDNDAQRLIEEYDRRHEKCANDARENNEKNECACASASREDKLRTATNNSIASILLFGNALSSAFNLLGVCIIATAPLVTPLDDDASKFATDAEHQRFAQQEIGRTFAMHFFLLAVLAPVLMQMMFSPRRFVWQKLSDVSWRVHVINACVGAVYAAVQYVVAAYVGPELPCLLAGFASLLTLILIVKGLYYFCLLFC
jgi:L-lactate permease